jgi:hypothetical protein
MQAGALHGHVTGTQCFLKKYNSLLSKSVLCRIGLRKVHPRPSPSARLLRICVPIQVYQSKFDLYSSSRVPARIELSGYSQATHRKLAQPGNYLFSYQSRKLAERLASVTYLTVHTGSSNQEQCIKSTTEDCRCAREHMLSSHACKPFRRQRKSMAAIQRQKQIDQTVFKYRTSNCCIPLPANCMESSAAAPLHMTRD